MHVHAGAPATGAGIGGRDGTPSCSTLLLKDASRSQTRRASIPAILPEAASIPAAALAREVVAAWGVHSSWGGATLGAHVNGLDGSDAEGGLDESDAETEITGRLYLLDGSHAEGGNISR